jgi:predicted SAM-dependent methyltransferase
VKLNLGSGGKPREGYLNIDKNPCAPRVDVVHDLDQYPWPFESEVADEILMEHCLEPWIMSQPIGGLTPLP